MPLYRFNVYGHVVAVERVGGSWRAYAAGADGTRSAADIVIPDFIAADELAQYLDDLFHESATPRKSEVKRIE